MEEVITNLVSVLKSKYITLLIKVHLVKAMVFPVVTYGCESWTIKKVKCQRIDAFQLWCWRRLLTVPWTARRSNQLILKELNPEYLLKELMLKLQYFGQLMQRAKSLEKDPNDGKDWEQEEKEATEDEIVGWHHQLDGHEFEQALGVDDGQGSLACCSPRGSKSPTRLSYRTELNWKHEIEEEKTAQGSKRFAHWKLLNFTKRNLRT